MSLDDYGEDVHMVPSADPDNAFWDPRARQLWDVARDNIKVPSPSTFFFNCMSMVAMAGATTLGRMMLALHNVKVHNMFVFDRGPLLSLSLSLSEPLSLS